MDSGWKIGSLKCSGSRWLDKSGAQEKGMGTEGDLGVINGHQSYFWSPGDEFPQGEDVGKRTWNRSLGGTTSNWEKEERRV